MWMCLVRWQEREWYIVYIYIGLTIYHYYSSL